MVRARPGTYPGFQACKTTVTYVTVQNETTLIYTLHVLNILEVILDSTRVTDYDRVSPI